MSVSVKAPSHTFSVWERWADRTKLADLDYPGVYLLADFHTAPLGPANYTDKHIIYVGETTKRTLGTRLDDFHRAAFKGNSGRHSGGVTFTKKYGKSHRTRLYVAVLPIKCIKNPVRSLYIQYLERKFLLVYAQKWGKITSCNKK